MRSKNRAGSLSEHTKLAPKADQAGASRILRTDSAGSTDGTGFVIQGDLDRSCVPALWLQREKLWQSGTSRITLSLAEAGHTDTAGLAMLVALQAEALSLGKRIELHDVPPQLQAAARLSQLDLVLNWAA